MRRLLPLAIFALLIALPGLAQRGGGGHASGGGHAGMSSGGHAFAGGGHAGFASHAPMGHSAIMASRGRSFPAVSTGPFGSRGAHLRGRYGHRFRAAYRGYPWAYGYYGDPWLYDDYGDYDYSQQSPNYYSDDYRYPDNSDDQNAAAFQEELDRLHDEVSRLRDQRNSQQEASAAAKPDIHAETVLVFRDKHTQEVQNYAIVGKTIWIFNEQRATKIPLADLDIPATTKANDDRGVDFRVPALNS